MLKLFEFRTLSASLEEMTNLMVTGSGEVYGVRLPREWTLRMSKGPRRYYPFVSPFELPVRSFPVTPVELPGNAEWEEEPTAIFHP
jgi:hypothetical protein